MKRMLWTGLVAALGLIYSAQSMAEAPYIESEKPIFDDSGKRRVIVDFASSAREQYAVQFPRDFDTENYSTHPQTAALIADYERRYQFKSVMITSWVGSSVTAYLSADQIKSLRNDSNVKLMSDDEIVEFSAPPWSASWNGAAWTELIDYGRVAVNGKSISNVSIPSDQRRTVYIIDSGVAYHTDLSSVVGRVNTACNPDTTPGATSGDCSTAPVSYPGVGYYSKVGCYAHATHVAGIIGAQGNNGINRIGVYAGVKMFSIGSLIAQLSGGYGSPWATCGKGNIVASSIGYAFDYIYFRNIEWATSLWGPFNPNKRANIVNMSINSGQLGYTAAGVAQSNRSKLLTLVTPGYSTVSTPDGDLRSYYRGVFFAQSAGNQGRDSCSKTAFPRSFPAQGTDSQNSAAFMTSASATSTSANDGIMVVGAVNRHGYPVVDKTESTTEDNGHFAETIPSDLTGKLHFGSNYGECIDIWAPGNAIYSTWGYGDFGTRGDVTYTGGQPNPPPGPAPNFTVGQHFSAGGDGSFGGGFSGWAWLSGTSMAAPHVAAAAAYVAEKYDLKTPAEIEQKIRANWKDYGTGVKIVYLPN